MENDDQEKAASDFLLIEYQELLREFGRLRDEGVSRLNFYVAITSSILAGLVLLSQVSLTPIAFQVATIGASFFLLLIGWPIFRYTIYRDRYSDEALRSLSRVRQYFASHSPSIQKYISRPLNDEPTSLLTRNRSSVRITVQSIIGLLSGAITGLSVNLAFNAPLPSGVVGGITFFVVYFVLYAYSRSQLKQSRDIAIKSVRFPKDANPHIRS